MLPLRLLLIIFYLYICTNKLKCDPNIPDIFDINPNKTVGYTIHWEVNVINGTNQTTGRNTGTTYEVTEYYDILFKRGRVDIVQANGINGTFIYDENTQELYHLFQGTCTLKNLSDANTFPALQLMLNDYWKSGFQLNRTILGPSVYLKLMHFLKNSTDKNGNKVVRFMQKLYYSNADRRYNNASLWNADAANGEFGWVFADPTDPNPYGFKNMSMPIWVGFGPMVNGAWVAKTYYEVGTMLPFIVGEDRRIHVPLGLGCGRNKKSSDSAPKPPKLRNALNADMKLEVVMQPSWVKSGSDSNPSNLVDDGRLTFDHDSMLLAWKYTGFNNTGNPWGFGGGPWGPGGPGGPGGPRGPTYFSDDHDMYRVGGFHYQYFEDVTIDTGKDTIQIDDGTSPGDGTPVNPTRSIWDIRAGIVYIMDDNFGGCRIQEKNPKDFLLSINFKNGFKIPIITQELFLNDDFVYMGEYVERGIPVYAFEKVANNIEIGVGQDGMTANTVVFTHYYVKDNYDDGKLKDNLLLRIGITILKNETSGATRTWSTSININEFTTNLLPSTKQKIFNVQNCYTRNGDNKWFQIGFPITVDLFLRMYHKETIIEDGFLFYLYNSSDLVIPPTRVPQTLIGWDDSTLYINALMLERAPFRFDFMPISLGKQRLKQISVQRLVNNFGQCASLCLNNDEDCRFFSLCDNFMCLLGPPISNPTSNPDMIDSTNCSTFRRFDRENDYKMRTMDTLLNAIENKVMHPSSEAKISPFTFQIQLPNFNGSYDTVSLTGVQFKSGFKFGTQNSLNTDSLPEINNDRYRLKSLAHFVPARTDKRLTSVTSSGLRNCEQQCDDFNNNACASFSYCQVNMECILTTLHYEEVNNPDNADVISNKSGCVLLSREYMSDYTRFGQGVMVTKDATKAVSVKNEEACAMACSTDTDVKCRSFDMCFDNGGDGIKNNCFLHTSHYMDNLKSENINLTLDTRFVHCGHYSKNFASDFSVKPNLKYAQMDGKIEMTGVTVEECAHECVESQSNQCMGFTFCEGKKVVNSPYKQPVCYISPTNDDGNTVYYTDDNQCEIYFKGGIVFRLQPESKEPTAGYSVGAGAGVGIFMLLLGAFLAVCSIIIYNKRRAATNA